MAETVAVRHHLEEVPLASPSRTSGLLEVFRRRYLLRLMVRREIKARYAGSAIGLLWSYINPGVRFLTYFFVFGMLLNRGMSMANFAIHLFAGMVLINYFTSTVNSATKSLLSNKGVVQKMAMPREMFPFASMLVSLWHAGPQLIILLVACVATGFGSSPVWVPDLVGVGAALLGFAIVIVFATALGLMFACINVVFRDFGRIVQTFINMAPFAVPMMYPYFVVTDRFGEGIGHTLYMLNPLVSAVMLVQRAFWYPTCAPNCITEIDPDTGRPFEDFASDLWSRGFIMLGVCVLLLVLAQVVFSRMEKSVPERL